MKEEHKQFKYLFNAELGQLLIKTGITCQISAVWKRSEETAKTDPVEFANGTANFNQTLTLPVKMYLNTNTKLFEEKKVFVIIFRVKLHLHYIVQKGIKAQELLK